MAYRFNGGKGAVTCDVCNIIIDEYLSYKDYEACYNGAMSGCEGDFCMECIKGINKPKIKDKEIRERLRRRQKACE